ncbi:alanine racemase [Candidatus Falkowbacteria bacterium CG10_big_fil_rev_8_21_14_0_10_39_11]|uniref:Alanine racemase n=1 Tax=Candidatus Falkowbacteria bacterium CG10_big_fil_rev_8_21_14_0_10_39_11 TaxID=1974565 RepID=A0A2H0V888_9BACT|nr:MAG: alanine racemase [Candidatus Falkowbacteria bacterium CG10_big_fil_rev_8_21_14_0_10_39_11]
MENIKPKTWIELSQENINFNLDKFRNRVGEQVKIMGVVKSNAYGHGAIQVARMIEKKVDYFAVDSIDEALEIKNEVGGKPILILGYTLHDNLKIVIENEFEQVLANIETLERLKKESEILKKAAKVHLKIETGTSRQGIFQADIDQYLDLIKASNFLQLAGISTHFANIEDTTDFSFAMKQLDVYKKAVEYIEQKGFFGFLKHTASSAAAIIYPETHFDAVRVGISLYGLWSAPQTFVTSGQINNGFALKPVLTWKTIVAHIKTLPAGTYVSYGCTEKVEKETQVAVLPIGYRDGFDRKLSSIGEVLIHGKRCRVLGRVCMNMVVVDIDHLDDVQLEDDVVLIGPQYDEVVTAEEIAAKINTINYEVVTRINWEIERRKI